MEEKRVIDLEDLTEGWTEEDWGNENKISWLRMKIGELLFREEENELKEKRGSIMSKRRNPRP